VDALEQAKPALLSDISESTSFVVPAPAPEPPPTAKWIRYQVDLEDFENVAETVGSDSPSEVGRTTFEWYLEYQVD
jgi:hypothetical protein